LCIRRKVEEEEEQEEEKDFVRLIGKIGPEVEDEDENEDDFIRTQAEEEEEQEEEEDFLFGTDRQDRIEAGGAGGGEHAGDKTDQGED